MRFYCLNCGNCRISLNNCDKINNSYCRQNFTAQILVKYRPFRPFFDKTVCCYGNNQYIPIFSCGGKMPDMTGVDKVKYTVAVNNCFSFFFKFFNCTDKLLESFDFPGIGFHRKKILPTLIK